MSKHGYEIKTSVDFLRKLLDEREDFLKTPTSSRHAINFTITAWQLHEWIYAEKYKYTFMQQFKDKEAFRNYLYKKEDFKTLHDLCDGVKHFELTKRPTTVLNTTISSYKSKMGKIVEIEPTLFLTTKFGKGGLTMTFDDLVYIITLFWFNFFNKELKEDVTGVFSGYTLF